MNPKIIEALKNLKPKRPPKGSVTNMLDQHAELLVSMHEKDGATYRELSDALASIGVQCSENTIRPWYKKYRTSRLIKGSAATKSGAVTAGIGTEKSDIDRKAADTSHPIIIERPIVPLRKNTLE